MAYPTQDTDMSQQKLSRYRSTRQKTNAIPHIPSEPVPGPPTSYADPAAPAPSVQRSRSRYRRANPAVNGNAPPLDAAQNAKVQQARLAEKQSRSNGTLRRREYTEGHAPPVPPHMESESPRLNGSSRIHATNPRDQLRERRPSDPEELAKLEARRLMEKEASRQQALRERMNAQQTERDRVRRQEREEAKQRQEEEEAQLRRREEEEQAQRDADERLRRQREQAARSRQQRSEGGLVAQAGNQNAELRPSGSKELFGVFRRKRGDTQTRPQASNDVKLTKAAAYQAPFHDAPQSAGPAHGMDAPISAVNAGERQVLVEANGSRMWFAVTPTTTSMDLVRSAAKSMPGNINSQSSVLMENFGKVGVTRPLRKYEHIRDVMNSWDDDKQNTLNLVPSATGGNDTELDANHAPKSQPEEFACQLVYSQKPGKWDKRWVTLREDGQVTVAKKQGMKQADQTNVCHISDFDIYTPLAKQASRKIRPPKKHCFAIKSQQKSNLFMSMESFVHFFCSSDKKAAALFYRAVQSWRSWYLANVLAQGQKSTQKTNPTQRTSGGAHVTTATKSNAPHLRDASKEYQLGSFKPLIDSDVFNSAPDQQPSTTMTRQRTRSNSNQGQGISLKPARTSGGNTVAPPSSFNNRLNQPQQPTQTPTSPSDPSTFAPSGLLGRTYSKRQAEVQARESDRNGAPVASRAAPVAAPQQDTLSPPPRGSIDQGPTSNNLKRSSSQRKPNKPLIDLTPAYREPPQHAKKGKGFYPTQLGTGGLIDSATSPEEAINVPGATDWRSKNKGGPPTASRGAVAAGGGSGGPLLGTAAGGDSGMQRTMSLAQRTKSMKRVEPAAAAAAEGFAAGSLLDKVQKEGREHYDENKGGMVWDRSRSEEVTVGYGEGV